MKNFKIKRVFKKVYGLFTFLVALMSLGIMTAYADPSIDTESATATDLTGGKLGKVGGMITGTLKIGGYIAGAIMLVVGIFNMASSLKRGDSEKIKDAIIDLVIGFVFLSIAVILTFMGVKGV